MRRAKASELFVAAASGRGLRPGLRQWLIFIIKWSLVNVDQAYDNWAEDYDSDRNLTRDLDQEVKTSILSKLSFKTILEIGCGTGKNTRLLASIAEKVHSLDFSEGMILKAMARPGLSNCRFSLADIRRKWPSDDHSIDLVVCNLVLEHIEDLRFIFSESFRSLVKGGRLFVCELHPYRQYQGDQAKFQSDQGERRIAAFVHNISDYLNAAAESGFELEQLKEWWHKEDKGKSPRLASFMFKSRERSEECP